MERWRYRELYSCPLVVVLGWFRIGENRGAALIPMLNYRVNILFSQNSSWRIVSNMEEELPGSEESMETCREVALEKKAPQGFLRNAYYKTMYYGGLNLFLDRGGEAVPVTIDYVDTERYYFYLKLGSGEYVETGIEPWILLGTGLRTGVREYVVQACRMLGSYVDETCRISVSGGEFIVSFKELSGDYLRVFPDNNSLRHVVKI